MKLTVISGKRWEPHHALIDLKEVTFFLLDGTAVTPKELEIKIGEGDFTWSETSNYDYLKNRGLLDQVRAGDQVPMEINFTFQYEYIKGTTGTAGVPTVEDFLKQKNAAAAYVSTDSDTCAPYCVDIKLRNVPGCGENEEVTFPDFRYEKLDHNVKSSSISCSGKCNAIEPNITRPAST